MTTNIQKISVKTSKVYEITNNMTKLYAKTLYSSYFIYKNKIMQDIEWALY